MSVREPMAASSQQSPGRGEANGEENGVSLHQGVEAAHSACTLCVHTWRGVSGCPAPAAQLAVWVSKLSGVSSTSPFPCHTSSFGSEPRS